MFGDVRIGFDAENAARRGIDESAHASRTRLRQQHPNRIEVHLARQDLIDIAGGIVGNGGEVDDRIHARDCFGDDFRIAQVPLD